MKFLKTVLALFFIVLFLQCCKQNPSPDVKKKIMAYYEIGNVKDYKPISFSEFDTTFISKHSQQVHGKVIHKLSARGADGKIKNYTHEFFVQVFPDQVVATRVDGSLY